MGIRDWKISLAGGGESLDLRGLGLAEWPNFFDGFEQAHRWDEASGAYRGEWPIGVQTLGLKLHVQGASVAADVKRLLEACTRGDGALSLIVQAPGQAPRSLACRFVAPGGIVWYPHPADAVFAEVPIQLEAVNPVWKGQQRQVVISGGGGWVTIPYAGDMPAWPMVEVSGGHAGLEVKMTASDPAVALAHHAGGLIIHTDPRRRGVVEADTGLPARGVAAYWPDPPALEGGGLRVFVKASSPAPDFKAIVTVTEHWRKAW